MKTIELRINETARASTHQEEAASFNSVRESFETLDQLKEYLIERYGKMPQGCKKIYRDIFNKDGNNETVIVGFLHSFWNQDISHNSKKWYQTYWIEFWEQETIKIYNIKLK